MRETYAKAEAAEANAGARGAGPGVTLAQHEARADDAAVREQRRQDPLAELESHDAAPGA